MADFPPEDCRPPSDHATASPESGTNVQEPLSEAAVAAIVADANAADAALDRAALAFVRAWGRVERARERLAREQTLLALCKTDLDRAIAEVGTVALPLLVGRAVIDIGWDPGQTVVRRAHPCRRPKG